MEKYCKAGQATDDNTAHAHCMLDNQGYKHTYSGCVIIIALPLQQWLHERTSMLRYTYIACLVIIAYFLFHHLIDIRVSKPSGDFSLECKNITFVYANSLLLNSYLLTFGYQLKQLQQAVSQITFS